MNDNETEMEPHSDFVDGFNLGYVLAAQEPELALQIADQINSTSERSAGFTCGIAQYAMEKDISMLPEWMKSSKMDKSDVEKDIEPGKEDVDLELE